MWGHRSVRGGDRDLRASHASKGFVDSSVPDSAPDTPMLVHVVERLTGSRRVDSQLVGATPCDLVKLLAVVYGPFDGKERADLRYHPLPAIFADKDFRAQCLFPPTMKLRVGPVRP